VRRGGGEEGKGRRGEGEGIGTIAQHTHTDTMVQNTLPHLCLYEPCNQQRWSAEVSLEVSVSRNR